MLTIHHCGCNECNNFLPKAKLKLMITLLFALTYKRFDAAGFVNDYYTSLVTVKTFKLCVRFGRF